MSSLLALGTDVYRESSNHSRRTLELGSLAFAQPGAERPEVSIKKV
jgi:hypothetical protein